MDVPHGPVSGGRAPGAVQRAIGTHPTGVEKLPAATIPSHLLPSRSVMRCDWKQRFVGRVRDECI